MTLFGWKSRSISPRVQVCSKVESSKRMCTDGERASLRCIKLTMHRMSQRSLAMFKRHLYNWDEIRDEASGVTESSFIPLRCYSTEAECVSLSSWSNERNPIKGITIDILFFFFLLLLLLLILFLEVALSGQSISYTWRPRRMFSLAIFLRLSLSLSTLVTLVPLLHPAHSGLNICVGASDVSLTHLHQCIQLPTLSLSHPSLSLSPSPVFRFVFLFLSASFLSLLFSPLSSMRLVFPD